MTNRTEQNFAACVHRGSHMLKIQTLQSRTLPPVGISAMRQES